MLKKLFSLHRKNPKRLIKPGQYWIAQSHINCEKKGTIKKIISVSKTHVKVSSNKGFHGTICINQIFENFEIDEHLTPKKLCNKKRKSFKHSRIG